MYEFSVNFVDVVTYVMILFEWNVYINDYAMLYSILLSPILQGPLSTLNTQSKPVIAVEYPQALLHT